MSIFIYLLTYLFMIDIPINEVHDQMQLRFGLESVMETNNERMANLIDRKYVNDIENNKIKKIINE